MQLREGNHLVRKPQDKKRCDFRFAAIAVGRLTDPNSRSLIQAAVSPSQSPDTYVNAVPSLGLTVEDPLLT